jgi:hypothetical protein
VAIGKHRESSTVLAVLVSEVESKVAGGGHVKPHPGLSIFVAERNGRSTADCHSKPRRNPASLIFEDQTEPAIGQRSEHRGPVLRSCDPGPLPGAPVCTRNGGRLAGLP